MGRMLATLEKWFRDLILQPGSNKHISQIIDGVVFVSVPSRIHKRLVKQ